MTRIGFLEDDRTLSLLYTASLKKLGFESMGFTTVASFISALSQEKFDLLLLDWTLPDGHADTVIKWVRENINWEIPIVIASAVVDEDNIVKALWLGADDYVTKPIRVNELVARVLAVLRRVNKQQSHKLISYPPYAIDIKENKITVHGEVVPLTQKEFDLAFFLFENADRVVSRVQVLHKVWGQSGDIETRTIDAHVSKIKKKLQIAPENGWKISSVYGYGYRLERAT